MRVANRLKGSEITQTSVLGFTGIGHLEDNYHTYIMKTLLSMLLPFNLYKYFMTLFTYCLSSSFFLAMRSSHDSTTISSKYFSLQGLEQDSSIKSMQEDEASTLEIGIAQGIDCFIFKNLLVS